jgi:hypothetical protein
MIGTNLFCAAAVAVMLLGLAPGRYGVLYAALVAENAGIVLYAPAWQARTPAVVGTGSLLSSANALNAASSGVVRLVGGPLGGILLALSGARWLIGVDAVSCTASRWRGRCFRSRSSTWRPTPHLARCSSCSGSSGSAAASTPGSCWPAWA